MNQGGTGAFVNDGTNAPNPGMRFRASADGTATAGPEAEGSDNIVFILGENAFLLDTSAPIAAIRRSKADIMLKSNASTAQLFAISDNQDTTFRNTRTGIFFENGGIYMQEAYVEGGAIATRMVELLPAGSTETGVWYTVESVQQIVADNVVYANAKIYDASGALIAKSGFRRVGTDFSTVVVADIVSKITTNRCRQIQIAASDALVDNWTVATITDVDTTASISFEKDDENRKVYKFISTFALDKDFITDDIIEFSDEVGNVIPAGFAVTYDETAKAIVVTMNDALPYNLTVTMKVKDDTLLTSSEGCILNYGNYATAVAANLTQTITTPADVFTIDNVTFDASNNATVTLSNADSDPREYLIIVSRIDANGKYLETAAKYGTLAEDSTATPIAAPMLSEINAGETIKVMVWDNWVNMSFFAEVSEIVAQ